MCMVMSLFFVKLGTLKYIGAGVSSMIALKVYRFESVSSVI